MLNIVARIKSSFVVTSIFLVILSTSFPALAVGPIGPIGPTEPTGPQTITGPIEPTGPQTAVGPQEITDTTSEITATNSTTGPDSLNTNSTTSNTDTTATIDKDATITNDVNVDANTGDNNVVQNTLVGDVATGDIQGSINILNLGNSVFGDGSSVGAQTVNGTGLSSLTLDPTTSRMGLNQNTGPNSANMNELLNNNNLTLISNSDATADNTILVNANTGGNLIAQNTGVGDITTGDTNIDINLFNILNAYMPDTQLTLDVWSVYGFNGDIIIPASNDTTGPGSINENESITNTNVNVDFNQDANIMNDLDVTATTGGNTIANNTNTGVLETGEVNVDGTVTNIANTGNPILYIVNVFGDWLGGLFGDGSNVIVNELGNQNTGPSSENINSVENNTNIDATINQTATANNKITVNANSGQNTITDNTGVGNITTGDINVTANVVNILNSLGSNLSKYTIRIVNIFGNWGGSVKTEQAATAQTTGTGGTTLASQAVAPSSSSSDSSQGGDSGSSAASSGSSSGYSGGVNPVSKLIGSITNPGTTTNSVANSDAGASDSTTIANASTEDGGVLIKSYASKSAAVKGGLSADLVKVLLVALGVLLLWGAVEFASARNKKQVQ